MVFRNYHVIAHSRVPIPLVSAERYQIQCKSAAVNTPSWERSIFIRNWVITLSLKDMDYQIIQDVIF